MEEDNYHFSVSNSSLNKFIDKKMKNNNINSFSSFFGLHCGLFLYNNQNKKLTQQKIRNKLLLDSFKKKNNNFVNKTKVIISNINFNMFIMEKNSKKDLLNFTSYYNKILFSKNIGRYTHFKSNEYFIQKINSISIIQKFIRGWLVRNSLNKLINYIIKYRLLRHIIKIQKNYKTYFVRKKIRHFLLIKFILIQRKKNWILIEKYIKRYYIKNRIKKYILITNLLKNRLKKITFLQRAIKTFYMKKICSQIINHEKFHYVLTYPFNANKVQLKIFWNNSDIFIKNNSYLNLNDKYDIFDFEICPIRKIFVLYIYTENILPGKYRCQFIINGMTLCDGRFPHIECNGRQLYNILNFDPWKTHLEEYNFNENSYIKENNVISCPDNLDGFSYSSFKLKNSYYIDNKNTNKSIANTNSNSYSSLNNYEEYFSSNSLFKKNVLKEIIFGEDLDLKFDEMLFFKK